MTRRPLTVRELQQCVAPGDVHLVDDGVTFFVDQEAPGRPGGYARELPSGACNQQVQTYVVDDGRDPKTGEFTGYTMSHCCGGGPHGYPYFGHAGDCSSCTKHLPDWARTVVELPRLRKPCGRLCIMVQFLLWVAAFSGAGAAMLGILAWLMDRS